MFCCIDLFCVWHTIALHCSRMPVGSFMLKSHFCMAFARIPVALALHALPASRCLLIFASSFARSYLFLDFMMTAAVLTSSSSSSYRQDGQQVSSKMCNISSVVLSCGLSHSHTTTSGLHLGYTTEFAKLLLLGFPTRNPNYR